MGQRSKIQWTHHTFNPWWGCVRVSDGCARCYAESFSHRLGLNHWGPITERRFFGDAHWAEPLKWNRQAEKAGARKRVFCASMADVFEDRRDLDESRSRLWELIEATPWLDWLLLTKRIENAERLAPEETLRRCWVGTTVEHPSVYDRIEKLLATPAGLRFLSVEPLLGPLDLEDVDEGNALHVHPLPADRDGACFYEGKHVDRRTRCDVCDGQDVIDWVIVGGESGPGARPCDVGDLGRIVAQCRAAGVPCFVKQLGSRPIVTAPHSADWPAGSLTRRDPDGCPHIFDVALKARKGDDPNEWPAHLRVREMPNDSTAGECPASERRDSRPA